MKKAELEEAVAELMSQLRWAVLTVNAERKRRRPRGGDTYAVPLLGRRELLAVERRVEKRKGGAS